MDDCLASLEPDRLEGLRPWLTELGWVFPSLAATAGRSQTGVPAERYRTYRAVRALLEELAATQPVVLILDDLHWADPASVELLSHLLAHPPQGPTLVVVAFRPAQLAPELAAALAAAAREDPGGRLELSPLSRAEADELARAGDRQRAVAELERAEVELGTCGAQGYVEQAWGQLQRLGRRSQPRGRGEQPLGLARPDRAGTRGGRAGGRGQDQS